MKYTHNRRSGIWHEVHEGYDHLTTWCDWPVWDEPTTIKPKSYDRNNPIHMCKMCSARTGAIDRKTEARELLKSIDWDSMARAKALLKTIKRADRDEVLASLKGKP